MAPKLNFCLYLVIWWPWTLTLNFQKCLTLAQWVKVSPDTFEWSYGPIIEFLSIIGPVVTLTSDQWNPKSNHFITSMRMVVMDGQTPQKHNSSSPLHWAEVEKMHLVNFSISCFSIRVYSIFLFIMLQCWLYRTTCIVILFCQVHTPSLYRRVLHSWDCSLHRQVLFQNLKLSTWLISYNVVLLICICYGLNKKNHLNLMLLYTVIT